MCLSLLECVHQLIKIGLHHFELIKTNCFLFFNPCFEGIQSRIVECLRLNENFAPLLIFLHHIIHNLLTPCLSIPIFLKVLDNDIFNFHDLVFTFPDLIVTLLDECLSTIMNIFLHFFNFSIHCHLQLLLFLDNVIFGHFSNMNYLNFQLSHKLIKFTFLAWTCLLKFLFGEIQFVSI